MSNITTFLQKSFQSFLSSIILPLDAISYSLVKCAKAHSYIETLGEHADALHIWIKKCYEEDFKKAYEMQVRKAIHHLSISYVRLAFDITDEPFYGKTRGLHIFNTYNESYEGVFRFITVCVVLRNKSIPLMAFPMRIGEGNGKCAIKLLGYCQELFNRIRLVVFDRGFYIAELIDYLEAKKIHYIILVPEREGRIEEYVTQTNEFGKYKHEMSYKKEKSSYKPKTMIVICKGVDDFTWIFATNIHFNTRVEYIFYYKRRWQIETNYRVEDEGRIKSKSTEYLVRYFYFIVSLLLHLLWIVNKNIRYHVPYKRYLDIIEQKSLYGYLAIRQM